MEHEIEIPPPYSEIDPSVSSFSLSPMTSGSGYEILLSQYDLVTPTSSSSHDISSLTTDSSVCVGHVLPQPLEDENVSTLSTAAQAYFLSREPLHQETNPPEIYYLPLHQQIGPADLPYQSHFSAKDITKQDWATFLNFLLPEHVSLLNNSIINQKIQAELVDQQLNRLALDDSCSTTAGCNSTVQLEPFRPFEFSNTTQSEKAVVSEWNSGFFMPRGLQIIILKDDNEGQLISLRHDKHCSDNEDSTVKKRNELLGYRIINDETTSQFGKNESGLNSLLTDIDGDDTISITSSNPKSPKSGLNEIKLLHPENLEYTSSSECESLRETYPWSSPPRENRVRSKSGSSMKSSSSSSASISSLESLPDYNDLSPQQLKNVGRLLLNWVLQPESNPLVNIFQQVKQGLLNFQSEESTVPKEETGLQAAEIRELFEKLKKSQRDQQREKRRQKRKEIAAKRYHKRKQRIENNKNRYFRRKNKINLAAVETGKKVAKAL